MDRKARENEVVARQPAEVAAGTGARWEGTDGWSARPHK